MKNTTLTYEMLENVKNKLIIRKDIKTSFFEAFLPNIPIEDIDDYEVVANQSLYGKLHELSFITFTPYVPIELNIMAIRVRGLDKPYIDRTLSHEPILKNHMSLLNIKVTS